MNEIKHVKAQVGAELLSKPNVLAVGIGFKEVAGVRTSDLAIITSVSQKLPKVQLSADELLPAFVESVPVDVQQVGVIRALQERTDRWRPAPGGVSIGHVDVSAGTFGCVVYKDGQPFILSNNHVLANSNNGQLGDPIIQPGSYDGGIAPEDVLAELADFVPVAFDFEIPDCPIAQSLALTLNRVATFMNSKHRFDLVRRDTGANLVDAAIARPLLSEMVTDDILEVGKPAGSMEGELGMEVQKSGRTTGLTFGRITQVNVTVSVLYGTALATFEDQLAGDLGSDGGDSGSIVLDTNQRIVGLLFAGGEGISIFNRWQNVVDALIAEGTVISRWVSF